MSVEIDDLRGKILAEAGREFNIDSPKQLAQVLFEELKLPPGKKTKTGYSTDISVLENLVDAHPIVEMILSYRELTKLKSTYAEALPKQLNPRTGRIHTSFNQTIASTGRLSSTAPNLQNIPVRTKLGREIRKAFIPDAADHRFVLADYSQIELRILAHFSGDERLRDAYAHERTPVLGREWFTLMVLVYVPALVLFAVGGALGVPVGLIPSAAAVALAVYVAVDFIRARQRSKRTSDSSQE